MPTTEHQGSSAPIASFGRSILSIGRDHVHVMDGGNGGGGELEAFQRHAVDLFNDLAGGIASGDTVDAEGFVEVLSLAWIRKLLDTFLICLEEFRAVLFNGRTVARAPLDRLVADFFDRAVRALDICNALRDGIEQMKQWLKHIDIALSALDPNKHKVIGFAQIRRAKKALADLAILMLDDRDSGSSFSHSNRSSGRVSDEHRHRSGSHFRSLSWSVSRSWSAAKQLQAIGNNLTAPRSHDITATSGLATPVFAMNVVLLFTVWALVAALPCQDRGLQTHFPVPRSFPWATPVVALHERILEESKKKDRKHSVGLLKEIYQVEKCTRHLIDILDNVELSLGEDKELEMKQELVELEGAFKSMKEGLGPMERQVREVFHRIVRSRTDGLDAGILQP